MSMLPRYPIYIPSKGRAAKCLTAKLLRKEGVPFRLVIEEQERDAYAKEFGGDNLLILPFSNQGSVIPARNWIKDHSIASGFERHWQLDDNIVRFCRVIDAKRLPCSPGVALRVAEDFVDRYENIAIAGLNYYTFYMGEHNLSKPPFHLNCHVYSCTLVLNSIPYRWRGKYNEDTDICLQALSGGWCTILVNAFVIDKKQTMQLKGGNTDELYKGDGRLKMARSLERLWPGVVTTQRRFKRPQHVIKNAWGKFDTPLKLKPGIDLSKLDPVAEYGMKLVAVRPVRSKRLRKIMKKHGERQCAKG